MVQVNFYVVLVLSQVVQVSLSLIVQGNNSDFNVQLNVSDLLNSANGAGRTDWNTSDVLSLCQQAVGQKVSLPQVQAQLP